MIKYLKPYKTDSPKIRLGANQDGGYVASQIAFEKCDFLMAYGYGGDKTYEDDFAKKFNKPVYLFDHTVPDNKWTQGLVNFFPEGLGSDNVNEAEKLYHISQLEDNINSLNIHLKSLQKNISTDDLKKSIGALDQFKAQLMGLNDIISLKGVREHYNSLNLETDEWCSVTLPPATPEEVQSTIKVMGGEDWEEWIDTLINSESISCFPF